MVSRALSRAVAISLEKFPKFSCKKREKYDRDCLAIFRCNFRRNSDHLAIFRRSITFLAIFRRNITFLAIFRRDITFLAIFRCSRNFSYLSLINNAIFFQPPTRDLLRNFQRNNSQLA